MKSEHLIYFTDLDNCYIYRSRCLNQFTVTILKLFAICLYYFVTFLLWCVKKLTIYAFQITAEAARIYLWTSHRLEVSGESVQLMCRAQGSPIPTVTWFTPRGKKIEHPTNKYEVSLESVLTMYYSLESVLTSIVA